MAEYLALESAYNTLLNYNDNFLRMMGVPLQAAGDYNDATDGCAMRMIKTNTPVAPHKSLLDGRRNGAEPRTIASLMLQTRLDSAFNPDCRHSRLLHIASGRYYDLLADGAPMVNTDIEFLELHRVRPKRDGKPHPFPIIRAVRGHDVIQRTAHTAKYNSLPDFPEAVNIQTIEELHTILGWAALKIEETAQFSKFRDATHYVEEPLPL